MASIIEKFKTNPATGLNQPHYTIVWEEHQDGAGRRKRRSWSVGWVPRDEAERLMAEKVREVVEVGDVAGSAPAAPHRWSCDTSLRSFTWAEFLPRFSTEWRAATTLSKEGCARALGRTIGDVPLGEISAATAERHKELRGTVSTGTLQCEIGLLRDILKHAHRLGVIEAVPQIDGVRYRAPSQPFLNADESRQLLRNLRRRRAESEDADCLYRLTLMALNTGMRRGELLSRGWEDIAWSAAEGDGAILVDAKACIRFQTKTGLARWIPLTPELRVILEDMHQRAGCPATGFLFPMTRDPSRPRTVFPAGLDAAAQACGFTPARTITPHALRRSWASRLAVAGVDTVTLMRLGGWVDSTQLDKVYAQVTSAHLVEQVGRHAIGPSRSLASRT